jgi:hypothetical protein
MKLSETQRKALAAIEASGGKAIAEGGGWWRGTDGKRLTWETGDWRGTDTVGTSTIYALEGRGLLKNDPAEHKPYYRATREITPAGRAVLKERE